MECSHDKKRCLKEDLMGEDPCGGQFNSRSQGSDATVFPLFQRCSLLTPDPVVNYSLRRTDDRQTLTLLMQATHPLLSAPHLRLKAVSPASYRGHCWKKDSLSTCQLIDGVEGASLDRHCCSAPPFRQRALASVLSGPHESAPCRNLYAFCTCV